MSFIENSRTGWARFLLITSMALFLECSGNAQQKTAHGSFAGGLTKQATSAVDPDATASISGIELLPTTVIGGNSSRLKVILTQAAPVGGVQIRFTDADPAVVTVPASATIVKGRTQVIVELATVAVTSSTSVALTASYNNSTAGATLTVNPSKAAPFTVKLQPAALSLDQGSTGSNQVVTKAGASFDNALTLNAANPPGGYDGEFHAECDRSAWFRHIAGER